MIGFHSQAILCRSALGMQDNPALSCDFGTSLPLQRGLTTAQDLRGRHRQSTVPFIAHLVWICQTRAFLSLRP